MLVGSHYRILKGDAVHPYTDLAPLRDDACPAFLPRGFWGMFTTFPESWWLLSGPPLSRFKCNSAPKTQKLIE
jgi:hypothetical protein